MRVLTKKCAKRESLKNMKLKTRKTVAKRFKITKNKKIIRRSTGQDHLNATQTGTSRTNKRRDKSIKVSEKLIRTMLPYQKGA